VRRNARPIPFGDEDVAIVAFHGLCNAARDALFDHFLTKRRSIKVAVSNLGVPYAKAYPTHPIAREYRGRTPEATILAGTSNTLQRPDGAIFEFESLLVGVSTFGGTHGFSPANAHETNADANGGKRIIRIYFNQSLSVESMLRELDSYRVSSRYLGIMQHEVTHLVDLTRGRHDGRDTEWAHQPREVRAIMRTVASELESYIMMTGKFSGSFQSLLEKSLEWREREQSLNHEGRKKIILGVQKYLQDRRLID
jgi:hypothetical protein